MKRREFIKTSVAASLSLLGANSFAGITSHPIDSRKVANVAFFEKKPLITHSNRPPLLESPREVFASAITPNDEFFVRWHSPKIITPTNINSYFISVDGEVGKSIYLSLDSLKNDFETVEVTSVLQCGGNSRSAFKPTTSGIQWGNGAMGCAKWRGVRLKDVLSKAGLSADARYVNFQGSDEPAFYKSPKLIRELSIGEISDEVIIAYDMNGEELPLLNGYPTRLVIPGHYSGSWIKALSKIEVTKERGAFYYMDKAYRIAENDCECESPENYATRTKPITVMNTKSIIGYPTSRDVVELDKEVVVKGVAFDGGSGIREVFISTDNAQSWESAKLEAELSRYAFREFRFSFTPRQKGDVTLLCKAVNNIGESQPFAKDIFWNRSGYKYNGIDSVTIKVL